MRTLLALLVLAASACGSGSAATTSSPGVVPTTSHSTDPGPATNVAALVLVHRVRGECPNSLCRETLLWSDGYFRIGSYDADAVEGEVGPSLVAAVTDAVASGELQPEPTAELGCDPGVDDVPDGFLVAVPDSESALPLSWCRHGDAELPASWDLLAALVNETEAAPTEPAADVALYYSLTGGCGMTGSCSTTSIDLTGRRWSLAPVPFDEAGIALQSSQADPGKVLQLVQLAAETDFAALRASLGEGVCNGCVDGIDFAFEFVGVGETLDSVNSDLKPANHPLLELMWAVAE